MNPLSLIKRHKLSIASLLFVVFFLVIYVSPSMFVYIYPGQAGLLFKALSSDPLPDEVRHEGLYVIAPWNKMYVYDVTKQKRTVDIHALSNDGLFITLRVSTIFHPRKDALKELATHIGKDYTDKIIIPTIFSSVRQVVGNYAPEELYTKARGNLDEAILAEASMELKGLPFIVENVIIERIGMPDSINTAIETKLKYQQDALAYQYILKKQEDESRRMKIEAEGIREYQQIVESNLTPDLLKWLQIRALHDLAGSQNSKIIVIGDPKNMPLVLDGSVENRPPAK
jgi:regulator of protease activity HflC (stomatin/prohibitin superfamily)